MTDSRSKQSLPRGTQCERVDWLEGLFNYLCHADPMSLEVPQSAAAFPETVVFKCAAQFRRAISARNSPEPRSCPPQVPAALRVVLARGRDAGDVPQLAARPREQEHLSLIHI